jgi:lysophospholipase L1-like esterase
MMIISGRATCVTNTLTTLRITIPGLTTVPAVCTIGSSRAGTWEATGFTIPAGTDQYFEVDFTPSATGSHVITVTADTQDTATYQFGVNTAGVFAEVELIRPEIVRSPGNWDILEVGAYADVAARCIQTGNSGAYLKFRVTDTNEAWLRLNLGIYGAMSAGDRPYIRVSVNGRNWTTTQISGQDYQILGIAGPADIIVQFWMSQFVPGYPRWSSVSTESLSNGVRAMTLFVPAGGDIVEYDGVKTDTMLACGDSITDGTGAGAPSGNDALYAYHQLMATGLGAEVGAIGFGGMGWLTQGSWMDGNFLSTWNTYSNGRPRDFTGLGYFFVNMGTNDEILGNTPGATIQSTIEAWLPTARAALPATTKIVVMVPPAGYYESFIVDAVASYKASTQDPYVYSVTVTEYFNTETLAARAQTWWSADSAHPTGLGHAHLAIAYQKSLYDKIGVYGSQANYETCGGGFI